MGRASSTIKKHLIRLKVLTRILEVWNISEVDNFIVSLRKRNMKNSSINSYVDTIRLYSRFNNYSEELQHYRYYKANYSVKGTFSDEEIEKILSLPCPAGDDKNMWDKYTLMFSLLAYTGCRPQEICNLKKSNIDWGRNVFIIEHTKTGIPRNVPIPPNMKDILVGYLSKLKTDQLFITTRDRVLSYRSYWHNFDKRKRLMKIDRPNITPYSFRHSFATRLLEQDCNIYKVSKIMGHSIKQTATYEHLTTKDIQEAVSRHPLIRKYTEPSNIMREIGRIISSYNLDKDERFNYSINNSSKRLNIRIMVKD